MNTVQIQNFVKTTAVNALSLENATQIDDFTYALPVDVDGSIRYAKVVITCTNNKDTKTTDAFNLEAAVRAYEEKCADRAERERTKAEEKAKREAKRSSKSSKAKAE